MERCLSLIVLVLHGAAAASDVSATQRCKVASTADNYVAMAEACSSAARDDALRANTVVGLTAAFAKAEQAVHLTQAAVGNHHIGDIAKAVEQLSAARGIYANIHVTSTVDPQFHAFVHEGMKSVEILLNRYQPLS